MCGVFGYVGKQASVVPMVANALRVMEYRGYDSWGIGWDGGSNIQLMKQTGRVPQDLHNAATSTIAIGHTRWATHGGVTDFNAHPHSDVHNQIAVVHNGVIENAQALKSEYLSSVHFQSDTDSEIVPHLVRHFLDIGGTFAGAVREAFLLLEGSSAIVAMDRSSEMIVAITARSPLRLGRRTDGWELASDPLACAGSSQEMAVIPDHHLVILTSDTAQLVDVHQGTEIAICWEPTPEELETSKGEFPHFTIKEIHDQIGVIHTLSSISLDAEALAAEIQQHRHVLLTGCGSALYAASLGANWLQGITDTWIDVVPASEISESTRNLGTETLLIAFTQSGETADVVDAISTARTWGARVATLVNTESSTVARMADVVLPICAGVERSVLATKSFMAMALRMHQVAEILNDPSCNQIDTLGRQLLEILDSEAIQHVAAEVASAHSMIVLGSGMGRAIAQEAALKIKEGSYLHAEAFLMGELKHGPLALVEHGTPCLIFATNESELASGRLAAAEVMSRGGFVIGIGPWQPHECSCAIHIESAGQLSSLAHLAAAQVLAYNLALQRDVNPDFPRNLAKSVTVR